MAQNTTRIAGRHFLQIPGPSPVPDLILRAMDRAIIDHRGPEFQKLAKRLLDGTKSIFKCSGPVVIYTATGTGAWEGALVNTLSPGDRVLMCNTGHFATLWRNMAKRLGLEPRFIDTDWRLGAEPRLIEPHLRKVAELKMTAVCVLHNETSTGCLSPIEEIRQAIDAAKHPALFIVDTISSLASTEYRHDEWGVDVSIGGAQKGLMLPPGMSFNAIGPKALAASENARLPKSFFAWDDMIAANKTGFFPYTPATNMLHGLSESLDMLHEEGLDNVFARHDRHAEATRRAVRAWGLEVLCLNPKEYSSSVTAVLVPPGHNPDELRKVILDHFNMSLGNALGKVQGRVFRIGHLGDFNDLMLAGTLSGVEMGLALAGIPHTKGGVAAALDYLTQAAQDIRSQALQAVLETASHAS